jgi:hypothetical protein
MRKKGMVKKKGKEVKTQFVVVQFLLQYLPQSLSGQRFYLLLKRKERKKRRRKRRKEK